MRLPREVVGIPIRRLILIAAVLAVVSFGGSLIYLLTRPPTGRPPAPVEPSLPTAPRRLLVPVDRNSLVIPDETERLVRSHWVRYRPPRDRWSADDVERFWIDPAVIGTEYLSRINRSLIEEMLKGIP